MDVRIYTVFPPSPAKHAFLHLFKSTIVISDLKLLWKLHICGVKYKLVMQFCLLSEEFPVSLVNTNQRFHCNLASVPISCKLLTQYKTAENIYTPTHTQCSSQGSHGPKKFNKTVWAEWCWAVSCNKTSSTLKTESRGQPVLPLNAGWVRTFKRKFCLF